MVKKIRYVLTKKDKLFLFYLLIFSIFISVIEMVGISAIMPFVAVATDFSLIQNNQYYSFIYNFFNFSKEYLFVVSFGVILLIFYLFRGVINLFYFYMLARFSQGRYHLLAYRLFEKYLGLSYRDFTTKNSSTLTKTIVNEAFNLTHILQAGLFMMSEIFIVILVYALLLYVNWKITLVLSIALGLNILFLVKIVSTKIKKVGSQKEIMQRKFYEIINRSFGNFKIIKLLSNDKDILEDFSSSSFNFAQANIKHQALLQFPRLFLETLGFGIMAAIVTYLVFKYEHDISSAIGLLSMFILALYRLMPSANRILNSYNDIMFHHKSLDIIYSDLMCYKESFGNEKINYNQAIELKNIDFEYDRDKNILKNINLNIKKGEKVAIIGESGSGKSTLVDIIIGLYKPKKGNIYIDNCELNEKNIKSWRKQVGYIPQTVYLFDGDIKENVAFGQKINTQRVVEVLKQAKIYDFLLTKDGIDTKVGENGIMLSGGQKQRIAIARALYQNPKILVLDEATSALDNETEKQIMNEIYEISEDKTLIIIAHRLSTLQNCDKIYKIDNGTMYEQ